MMNNAYMQQRIIILNGPPGSGKDAIATALAKELGKQGIEYGTLKLAQPLRDHIQGLVLSKKIILPSWKTDFNEWLEKNKDSYLIGDGRHQRTIREEMINYYKAVAAQRGETWLVEDLIERIRQFYTTSNIIITDAGRLREVHELTLKCPNSAKILVRVRRAGFNFGNDIRSWIYTTGDFRSHCYQQGIPFYETDLINGEERLDQTIDDLCRIIERSTAPVSAV